MSHSSSEGGFGDDFADIQQSPWSWWRQQMPICQSWAYFDHAAVSPLPQRAVEAISAFSYQASQLGDTVWPQWNAKIQLLHEQFGELLGAAPSDLFVIPNTSTGISLVAEGWPFQAGDNVVVPEGEFPSNLFPWQNQAFRGVQVRIVPRRGEAVSVEDLMASVDSRTQMIAVSWVGYVSGFRVAIAELVRQAHQRGVPVFLDAIQGLGVHPLDLREIPVDFLAADGHKWLLGPEGIGIAMIRAEHRQRMHCPIVGWNSVRNAHQFSHATFELRSDASRYEAGSANMIGAAALSASVEIFLKVRRVCGVQAIEDRVLSLANDLTEQLRTLGATVQRSAQHCEQSGIVTFTLPNVDPTEFRQQGLDQGVVVSCRGGGVRASVHAYNNESDIARLVALAHL